MKHSCLYLLLAALPVALHAEITMDGQALEPEWASATTIKNLALTQPDTGQVPEFQTTVRFARQPS